MGSFFAARGKRHWQHAWSGARIFRPYSPRRDLPSENLEIDELPVKGLLWFGAYQDERGYCSRYSGLFVASTHSLANSYDEHWDDLQGLIDAIEIVEDPDYDYDEFESSGDSVEPSKESSGAAGKESPSSEKPTSNYKESKEKQVAKVFDAGTYRIGKDCPAGEYKLTAFSHGYFCVYPDTGKSDILENSNFDKCEYITVSEGQCLEVSGATFVTKEDAETESGVLSGNGRYLVGFDCPAGEYKLTQTGDPMGYYCIFDNSTVDADIVQNNNFEGNDYCTVSEGQYLELSRCTAEQA